MPAGSTYTPIATTTLGSDVATYTFSSIPSTYTDLVLVMSVRTVNAASAIYCQLNSDTGTNYSNTQLLGNGSIANSSRQSSVNKMRIGNYIPSATSTFGVLIANFQNYANTTTYKTVISRAGSADGGLVAEACLWRSTAAISSILLGEEGAGNLRAGSTFTLYGIASA